MKGGVIQPVIAYIKSHHFLAMLVGLMIALPVLYGVEMLTTSYFDSLRQDTKQTSSRISRAINAMPDPADMTAGASNSEARFIVEQTARQQEIIDENTQQLQTAYPFAYLATFSTSHQASNLRSTNQHIEDQADDIQSQSANYTATLQASLEFIEYSPAIDTVDFSLGSEDSNERMERLRNGLDRADDELSQIDSSDLAQDVDELIAAAKTAQQELEDGGSVEDFVDDFQALQASCIELFTDHYRSTWPELQEKITSISKDI